MGRKKELQVDEGIYYKCNFALTQLIYCFQFISFYCFDVFYKKNAGQINVNNKKKKESTILLILCVLLFTVSVSTYCLLLLFCRCCRCYFFFHLNVSLKLSRQKYRSSETILCFVHFRLYVYATLVFLFRFKKNFFELNF